MSVKHPIIARNIMSISVMNVCAVRIPFFFASIDQTALSHSRKSGISKTSQKTKKGGTPWPINVQDLRQTRVCPKSLSSVSNVERKLKSSPTKSTNCINVRHVLHRSTLAAARLNHKLSVCHAFRHYSAGSTGLTGAGSSPCRIG